MPRILLLGKFGQLGWELHRSLAPLGEVFALDYPEIDLTKLGSLPGLIHPIKPAVIVNATAYTAVDQAEEEPETAMKINSQAPRRMAEIANELGAALIHYSTDYVFDGINSEPYRESDTPNPLGIYGKSKFAGEMEIQEVGGAFLILRTSWVYSLRRSSFVTKVLSWSRQQTSLKIVDDQVSNPTWCRMLAETTAQLLAKAGRNPYGWLKVRSGLYHLAGSGYTSRFNWAKKIIKNDPRKDEQIIQDLQPAQTSEFPTPAERPLFSALDCDLFTETFGLRLPDWEEALFLAMGDEIL
jgi:dTDP-4-dehydrorhamnose reductase